MNPLQLTPTEDKVYSFLRWGRKPAHIARVMKISVAAVHVYTSRIKRKIGLPMGKALPPHLAPLTRRQREAVTMHQDGKPQREIAQAMGITQQAVANLIYLASKRIAQRNAPEDVQAVAAIIAARKLERQAAKAAAIAEQAARSAQDIARKSAHAWKAIPSAPLTMDSPAFL